MSYPPLLTPGRPGSVKQSARRFTVAPAGESFEVVDFDGRPVIPCADKMTAAYHAQGLNSAAFKGSSSLAQALVGMD